MFKHISYVYISIILLFNAVVTIIVVKWFHIMKEISNNDFSKSDTTITYDINYNNISYKISLNDDIIHDQNSDNEDRGTLPQFAYDGGDYIVGSVLELSYDSYGPFITTFFLDHHAMMPYLSSGLGILDVHEDYYEKWHNFYKISNERALNEDIVYEMSGKRVSKYEYKCKIQHSELDKPYVVTGSFLPNRLSIEPRSNRRLDILRCPMKDMLNASSLFRNTEQAIHVEIQWNMKPLVQFSIPWKTRCVGYNLYSPSYASHLDVWKGYTISSIQPETISQWNPVVHLCMPGTRLPPSKRIIALMLEYISHHYQLGFSHIYLSVSLLWESVEMNRLLLILKTYIDDGIVSIHSISDDMNGEPSTSGLQWRTIPIKIFTSTMTLYLCKGYVDYLAVFDIDEFYIPRVPSTSIINIIKMNDIPSNLNRIIPGTGSKLLQGFSDKQNHPLCYLILLSEIIAKDSNKKAYASTPWIGESYSHGPETVKHLARYDPYGPKIIPYAYSKVILPTRKIYQAGYHTASACRLEWKWTICGNESISSQEEEFCERGYGIPERVSEFHRFDEVVGNKKLRTINPWRHAVIYHYMLYHDDVSISNKSRAVINEYSRLYYPNVKNDLKLRDLFDLIN